VKRRRANSSCATSQVGRPSACGRRASEVVERVLRDGRWRLGHRESQPGACASRSLPAAPGVVFWRRVSSLACAAAGVSSSVAPSNGSALRPCAERTAWVARSPRSAPAFGSCLRGLGGIEGRAEERLPVLCRLSVASSWCHAQCARGKLALMVRKQVLLHQPPNPSIERTSSSMLCMLPAAAHVQR